MRIPNSILLVLLCAMTAVAAPPKRRIPASSSAPPPDGWFEFGYKQVTNGKVSDETFYGRFECWSGQCSMITVNLMACLGDTPSSRARLLALDHCSTGEGSLIIHVVTGAATATIQAEESVHGARIRYRFDVALDQERHIKWLTGFSGAAVKDSALLGKVISWDLVYLKATDMLLDPCAIRLVLEELK
jgi:hypothetical protein